MKDAFGNNVTVGEHVLHVPTRNFYKVVKITSRLDWANRVTTKLVGVSGCASACLSSKYIVRCTVDGKPLA